MSPEVQARARVGVRRLPAAAGRRRIERRVEVRPASTFRLERSGGADRVLRCRGGVLERLLHTGDEPIVLRAAQTAPDRVLLGATGLSAEGAAHGIARMSFMLGLEEDLSEFHRRFSRDHLIGRSVRARPWLRVRRRPEPFEALAWAICEQLIEYERAASIQRRMVARLGRRCPWESGLRDAPTAQALADVAPALLQSFDLAGSRALTLVRAAREVACGRVDLRSADHEHCWRRLRAIPGIGPWTTEMLALHGQGRNDQLPAGDVGLLKLVGRSLSGGDPHARASEAQVRAFFAPYGEWAGLAFVHLITH